MDFVDTENGYCKQMLESILKMEYRHDNFIEVSEIKR